jgi:hypothetical protein
LRPNGVELKPRYQRDGIPGSDGQLESKPASVVIVNWNSGHDPPLLPWFNNDGQISAGIPGIMAQELSVRC